jgi:hypothetical protein
VVARLRSEQGADLIEDTTETRGSGEGVKPAQRPLPWLEPPMVLLRMMIHVAGGPGYITRGHEDVPNGAWVGSVASHSDPVRCHPGADPGANRAKISRAIAAFGDEGCSVASRCLRCCSQQQRLARLRRFRVGLPPQLRHVSRGLKARRWPDKDLNRARWRHL